MNELKERVKKQNIYYFLTYADNYAMDISKIRIYKDNFIFPKIGKDTLKYDGGTLMQCKIDKSVIIIHFQQC